MSQTVECVAERATVLQSSAAREQRKRWANFFWIRRFISIPSLLLLLWYRIRFLELIANFLFILYHLIAMYFLHSSHIFCESFVLSDNYIDLNCSRAPFIPKVQFIILRFLRIVDFLLSIAIFLPIPIAQNPTTVRSLVCSTLTVMVPHDSRVLHDIYQIF